AHDNNARRNCYLHRKGDPDLPNDHPRNLLFESSTRMIAYDLLPETSPLKTLYHWDATRQMVSDIVGADELYDSADPFQPVNVLCAERGDQSAWHFDSSNAFTMTLMLQAPDAGGEFELVPNTRSDADESYDYVHGVLTGKFPDDAVPVAREAGSLCIFRGCNSLHRVTPVAGDTMRIMAVFVYEAAPGVIGDPEVNANIYGPRAAATA
ncbi:MAG: HalD/BesD family halogenase, partial [Aestuariivirgaceae bacterium]